MPSLRRAAGFFVLLLAALASVATSKEADETAERESFVERRASVSRETPTTKRSVLVRSAGSGAKLTLVSTLGGGLNRTDQAPKGTGPIVDPYPQITVSLAPLPSGGASTGFLSPFSVGRATLDLPDACKSSCNLELGFQWVNATEVTNITNVSIEYMLKISSGEVVVDP